MREHRRILIVDDEPYNVDYIQQELDDLGYEMEIATNGREALERVAARPPDLILLDVMMPELDGITVCRILKSDPATRLIPIVIMTALNAREDRIRGIEAGADDFLTKPVDERELLARIRTALQQKVQVDSALRELQSASEQLERLEPQTLDASILVLAAAFDEDTSAVPAEALGFVARRYISAYEAEIRDAGGEITRSTDESLTALFQHGERAEHAAAALGAAYAVEARTEAMNASVEIASPHVSVAVESGSLTVGTVRVDDDGGAHWELRIEGGAVEEAQRLLASGARGVRAGSETLRSVGSGVGVHEASRVSATERSRADAWWPAEFAGLEAEVHQAWDVAGEIYLTRTLGGKSGAFVSAVDVRCRGFDGQAILKLSHSADQEWDEPDEAERHRRALEDAPRYAAEHLAEIVHTHEHGGQVAILSTIAARALEYSDPWADCPYGQQLACARNLFGGLLESWNEDYVLTDGLLPPAELLRTWLAYRLDRKEGRIHAFLEDMHGLTQADASFVFEGHWYPNPLAFALETVPMPERLALRALRGRLHGDLHGYNVLVRSPSDAETTYYLIDLAMYERGSYLFYDHAYFELAHLMNVRGDVGARRWLAILDAISRDAVPHADDLGLVQLVAAARDEIRSWTERHEPNRPAFVESQCALARVAAGLNFVHKSLPSEQRLGALLYAAVALKGYLKFHGVDWPREGTALSFVR